LRIAAQFDLSKNLRRRGASLICRQLLHRAELHAAGTTMCAILRDP
jgi:hypothetical protein